MKPPSACLLAFLPLVLALGQNRTVTLTGGSGLLQLAGAGVDGQILLSANDWWGVIRAAEDLAGDVEKVTGERLTLGHWMAGESRNGTKKAWRSGPAAAASESGSWDSSSGETGHDSTEKGNGEMTVLYTYFPTTNNVNVSP
jgi:hypothetical protein